MEYIKDNRKDISKGIRFNSTRLNIALSKASKKSAQQLVDFLIDRYVNGENPILERQEPIAVSQVPRETIIHAPKINQYQAYYSEIKSAISLSEFPAIVKEIKADEDLSVQEKLSLEKLAIAESRSDRFL